MRQFILLASVVFLLSACGKEEAPLPPSKMENILIDVHLAEAYSQQGARDSLGNVVPRNLDSLAVSYNAIYAHHGITAAQFNEAMDWYRAHPAQLDSIYATMIPKLTKMESQQPVNP